MFKFVYIDHLERQAFFKTSIFAMRFWLLLRRTNCKNHSLTADEKKMEACCETYGLYVPQLGSIHNFDAHLQIRFWAPSPNTSNKYRTLWRLLLEFLLRYFLLIFFCHAVSAQFWSCFLICGNKTDSVSCHDSQMTNFSKLNVFLLRKFLWHIESWFIFWITDILASSGWELDTPVRREKLSIFMLR